MKPANSSITFYSLVVCGLLFMSSVALADQGDILVRPYAGVGVNYTAFLWNDATDRLETAVGSVNVDTSHSWGWAAQVGVDIDYRDNWYFNLDLKYIDIDTEASLSTVLGTLRVDLDVDPLVFGVGIGYRF